MAVTFGYKIDIIITLDILLRSENGLHIMNDLNSSVLFLPLMY